MPSRDRPEEIAITHEMIEAGVTAFFEWDGRVEEPSGLVVQVFEAMIARVSTSFARQPYPQSDSGVVLAIVLRYSAESAATAKKRVQHEARTRPG